MEAFRITLLVVFSFLSCSTFTTGRILSYEPLPPEKPLDIETAKLDDNILPCTANDTLSAGISSGARDDRYRWKNGFFVQIDPSFDEREKNVINSALYQLHQILCIGVGVWPSNSQPSGDYAFIKKAPGAGCNSNIGRLGGRQIINIDPNGCVHEHIVAHECIHALGFHHEQTRPDRDNYVNIFWDNIQPGMEHNYQIYEGSLTFNVPYDHKSVMHYDSFAFAKDRTKPAMLKKNGQTIPRNSEISPSDKLKLRRMYKCA